MKTYLNVSMELKDRAKRLGARWDAARQQWYCPDGVDLFPFIEAGWVPGTGNLSTGVHKALERKPWERPR